MNAVRRLTINPSAIPADLTRDEVIWQDPPSPSSFHSSLSPSLAELGATPPKNRDVVWLTTLVFLADRTVKRPKNLTRDLLLDVPVSSPDAWEAQRSELEAILSAFTSDNWELTFREAPEVGAPADLGLSTDANLDHDLVCLLSGGADSLCGAIKALDDGHRPILISHWDTNAHVPIQQELVDRLNEIFDVSLEHRQIRIARAATQIGGQAFRNETTKRSRSLLFLALGLAQAAALGIDRLWIPENGFASLNPPLAPERLGALSTRTTDPLLVRRFDRVLQAVGAQHGIENPFERATKGEMFAQVAGILGETAASKLLSETHSCSHSRLAGAYGRALTSQCGTCFGCLLRRAAFKAGGLDDRTPYLLTSLTGEDLDAFLAQWSEDLHAMTYATRRGVGLGDVLALRLSDEFSPDDALDLLVRGLGELKTVTS